MRNQRTDNANMTMPRTENHLSDVLRMLMNRAGIQSDNELADRLDAFENGQAGPAISQATISRILNGSTRDPRSETVRRIGRFFGVSESQMRGLDPIDGTAAKPSSAEPITTTAAETPAAPYSPSQLGEPGARECLALLSDFARLPAVKRSLVVQLAQTLRHREITPQTPIYSLEEIGRAVQASLFPAGLGGSQQKKQELLQTMSEIEQLLNMQKQEFFNKKQVAQSNKTSKI